MSDLQFTEEDLKRLKEQKSRTSKMHQIHLTHEELEAILHRLECAEAIVKHIDDTPEGGIIQEGYESLLVAWRKSKEER